MLDAVTHSFYPAEPSMKRLKLVNAKSLQNLINAIVSSDRFCPLITSKR